MNGKPDDRCHSSCSKLQNALNAKLYLLYLCATLASQNERKIKHFAIIDKTILIKWKRHWPRCHCEHVLICPRLHWHIKRETNRSGEVLSIKGEKKKFTAKIEPSPIKNKLDLLLNYHFFLWNVVSIFLMLSFSFLFVIYCRSRPTDFNYLKNNESNVFVDKFFNLLYIQSDCISCARLHPNKWPAFIL